MTLRLMTAADLPAVQAIQRACYGDGFLESEAVIARRLAAAPRTAWVAQARAGAAACAYLSAYPSRIGKLTALHGDFEPAADADTLYLHDLAVHPGAHGTGLGIQLVRHALQTAATRGWPHSALVSVQGSRPFWERLGYRVHPLADAAQQARLAGYEAQAVYMVR